MRTPDVAASCSALLGAVVRAPCLVALPPPMMPLTQSAALPTAPVCEPRGPVRERAGRRDGTSSGSRTAGQERRGHTHETGVSGPAAGPALGLLGRGHMVTAGVARPASGPCSHAAEVVRSSVPEPHAPWIPEDEGSLTVAPRPPAPHGTRSQGLREDPAPQGRGEGGGCCSRGGAPASRRESFASSGSAGLAGAHRGDTPEDEGHGSGWVQGARLGGGMT